MLIILLKNTATTDLATTKKKKGNCADSNQLV